MWYKGYAVSHWKNLMRHGVVSWIIQGCMTKCGTNHNEINIFDQYLQRKLVSRITTNDLCDFFPWFLSESYVHPLIEYSVCRCDQLENMSLFVFICVDVPVLGFRICFQIHSTFWLILARAYWMTCILLISYWLPLNEEQKDVKEKVSQACKSWPFPLHFDITFELIELEKWVWSHIDHHWILL